MKRWLAPLFVVLALAVVGSCASARADEAGTSAEQALRRRVQRFYVFSYLNRHGEMWDLFTGSLQAQLGDDRKEYIRAARGSSYELYSSRIESLSVRGDVGVVEVALQAQLPGTIRPSWRRHRMLWRLEDGSWAYAGSMDVSDVEPAAGGGPVDEAQLQAIPGTSLGPGAAEELLPARPAEAAQAPAARPAQPTTSDADQDGERWDLVAIPPPGRAPPERAADGLPPAATPEAPATPPEAAAASASPTAAAPGASGPAPRRRASPPSSASAEDVESLAELVRHAATGNVVRRLRAVEKLRDVRDPAVIPLMVAALPEAAPEVVAAFLQKMAQLGSRDLASIARGQLGAESPTIRAAAASALGDLGGADDQPAVERLLSDVFADVRLAAISALGALGGSPGPALAAVLASAATPSPERVAAARAAGVTRAKECEGELLALMALRPPEPETAAAVASCGQLASDGCLAALRGMLDDPAQVGARDSESPLRLLAARALADAGAEGGGLALAKAMMRDADATGVTDVEVVATTGDLDALLLLLRHSRLTVRRRAADLAGRFVDGPDDASRAVAALTAARNAETDDRALLAFQAALERLR